MLSRSWMGAIGVTMECNGISSVKLSRRFAVLAFCFLAFVISSSLAFAAPKVLKDIKIQTRENDTKVDFEFGIPLRYVKHFPATSGEILQIQLLMENDQGREIHKEVRQGPELTTASEIDQVLIYVTYEEGVPGGPYLTLRFAHPVSFEVDAGSTSGLSVIIRDDQAKPKPKPVITAKPEVKAPPVEPPPTPPVAPSKAGVPEISMKTLEEQVFKQAEKTEAELEARQKTEEAPTPEAKTEIEQPQDTTTRPTREPVPSGVPAVAQRPAAPANKEADELMAKARQALTFGDNDGAIELLRRVIAMPENEQTQDARELVGLALERSNQIPRAKFEYKKYLKIYEEGEGPIRVRQRLQALQALDTERPKKLRESRRRTAETFTTFGRLSQAFTTRFQQRDPKNDDDVVGSEDITLTRRIDSYMSLRSRMRTEDRNIQLVFNGNHIFDLINSFDTESRVVSFYLDYDAFKQGYYTVMGRQRVRNSGVFSRFDGIIGGYDFMPWFRAHAYVGKPVELYDARPIDKNFWGLKVDVGRRNDPVNMNLYMVNQTADGFADRQAVGYGVRYADRETTVFGLLDYDFLFDDVNLLNLRWGWKYLENSKLNVSYNFRRLLYVSSALNNQPLDTTLGTLIGHLGEAEARRLAEDRTNSTSTLTLGNSYQFDRDNQINVDLTMFQSSGTVTRNDLDRPIDCRDPVTQDISNCDLINVPGAPETGKQYTLSTQWIAGNLFAQRDLYVFGLRLSKFDTYNDGTIFTNTRLPDLARWKLRPRLTMSYREFNDKSTTTGTRFSVYPAFLVNYAWKKEWIFDFELGVEWVTYTDENFDDEFRENVRIGYSYTF
ncbi:hypothetical protein [Kaarinaea lacus]